MTPEELERIRAELKMPIVSVWAEATHADTLLAEVDRLRKLFDDAGQGEHNVLALVEHYQAETMKAQADVAELKAELRTAMYDMAELQRRYDEDSEP